MATGCCFIFKSIRASHWKIIAHSWMVWIVPILVIQLNHGQRGLIERILITRINRISNDDVETMHFK